MTRKEIIQLWTKALRSGKYIQGKHFLCAEGKYCCLGVLCQELAESNLLDINIVTEKDTEGKKYLKRYHHEAKTLPEIVTVFTGLKPTADYSGIESGLSRLTSLAIQNDKGKTFDEIADIIESEPKGLFNEGE
jgi:hypothetical protein